MNDIWFATTSARLDWETLNRQARLDEAWRPGERAAGRGRTSPVWHRAAKLWSALCGSLAALRPATGR